MKKTLLEYCLDKLKENPYYALLPELDPEINTSLNRKVNLEFNPDVNKALNPSNPMYREEQIRLIRTYLGNYMDYILELDLIEKYFSSKE